MTTLRTVPTLAELMDDPGRLKDLPRAAVAGLRGQLHQLDTLLLMHVFPQGEEHAGEDGDRLLDVKEAAAKLSISEDALYRGKYPFKVRVGDRVRFSQLGIDRYIRQRSGS